MTLDELKAALAAILTEEEALNFDGVEHLAEATYVRLTTAEETPDNVPYDEVIDFLVGFIRRRSDECFAEKQRRWLRSYLRALD